MAQQNQNQTAVIIILSVFCLILLVVTWFLWKGYSEQLAIAKEAVSKLKDFEKKYSDLTTDAGNLKKWIGFADDNVVVADIEKAFTEDMQNHTPKNSQGLPVLDSYRVALGQTFKSLENEIAKNASLDRENKDLQNRLDVLNAEKKAMEEANQELVSQAKKDLETARTDFKSYMADQEAKIKKLDEEKNKAISDAEAVITVANENRTKAEQKSQKVLDVNQGLTEQLIGLRTPVITYFDTKITYVSEDNKTVWINRGREDGLTPRISFSVYAPSSNDVARDSSKGAIEITRILGPHTAEAKVTQGVITDPIMMGDLVFTPVWKPGQRLQFALSSGLDIDNDGNSDVYLVKNIVELNGGEVVAWIDDQSGGNEIVDGKTYKKVKREGQITKDTVYYVTGRDITENDSKELQERRKAMDEEAKLNNLETLKLPELLRRMGHQQLMSVEGFNFNRNVIHPDLVPGVLDHASNGLVHESYVKKPKNPTPSSNPAGYSPLFHKKGTMPPPASNGSVSEIFRPRTPKTSTETPE